jgi:hypothetical protein
LESHAASAYCSTLAGRATAGLRVTSTWKGSAELVFEAGKVEKVHDRSTAMAAFREHFGTTDIAPRTFARYGDFIRRYSSCFSADYGLLDALAELARLIGPSATG